MTRCLTAIVAACGLLFSAVAGSGAQTPPITYLSAPPAPSADAAVAEAVQTGGAVYAGDCADTTPANFGQDCSKLAASDGSMRAYEIGPTFSEYTDWVFVEQTQAGWIPIGSVGFNDTAGAPAVPWPAG